MKKILLSILFATTILTSCSKSSEDAKPLESNTVEISGTSYPTVKIGTQTWTAANYNGPKGSTYNNEANDPKVGKLYSLDEAKAIQLPSGWRLPTKEDCDKLIMGLGGTKNSEGFTQLDKATALKLMATSSWNIVQGSNDTKLNVLSVGYFNSAENKYVSKGEVSFFWTNTEVEQSKGMFQWSLGFWQEMDGVREYIEAGSDYSRPDDKLSVRFVKDN